MAHECGHQIYLILVRAHVYPFTGLKQSKGGQSKVSQRPASPISDFERAEAPRAVNSNDFERAEAPSAVDSSF